MPRGRPANFEFEDVDYSYVDVEDLLPALGVEVAYVSHGNAGFKCPFHNDHTPSARMSIESTAWLCNGCGEKGKNAVSFLAKIRSFNMTEAKRVLEERYGGSLSAPIDDLESEVMRNLEQRVLAPEARKRPPEKWIEDFVRAAYAPEVWPDGVPGGVIESVEYMRGRGFSEQTLREWQIGYDWISDRVTIPVYDETGDLVGFKGRAWRAEHEPKYLVLGDAPNRPERYGFQTYRKSEFVFGLNRFTPSSVPLIVVEGELNVIAMYQHGWSNIVAAAGAEFSDRQAQLIIERANSAIVFFDDNSENVRRAQEEGRQGVDAGRVGSSKVVAALQPHMPVNVVLDAPGDANELDPIVIESLLIQSKSATELQVRGLLPSIA